MSIALRHRIVSRMTSLVAVSEEPSVDPKAPRRRVALPVEVPAYVSAEAVGLKLGRNFLARMMRAEASPTPSRSPADFDSILDHSRIDELVSRKMSLRLGIRVLARVLAVEGKLLVIEFETPSDGFLRPDGEVEVTRDGQELGAGTIDPDRSSPRGPHAKGLLLRVVILGSSNWTCRVLDEVTITGGTTA
jgi:hypothetical protein